MIAMPSLSRITIYPIKSLDGFELSDASVLSSGALAGDRRWAIVDEMGQVVNAKRFMTIHPLRCRYADDLSSVTIRVGDHPEEHSFPLDGHRADLVTWLAGYFGFTLSIAENTSGGFPDDTDAPGPTLVSTATVAAVASWFPGLSLENVRRRFRANLEIDGVEPFWEDRLVGTAGTGVPFRIGAMTFEGVNPCQRCPVPTRDPDSGEAIEAFAKHFSREREASLPPWAEVSRFDHFYRLAVNTRPPARHSEGMIRVGDEVSQ